MRRVVVGAATALVASLALSACGGLSAKSSDTNASVAAVPSALSPEPGTAIPQETVKVGFVPFADELIGVIGAQEGYFKDVGINFTEPNGLKIDLSKGFTPLLNGQVDIASAYMPNLFPQLDNVQNVRGFMLSDVFLGNRIMAPKGEFKTVDELMKSGLSFKDAAAKAMAQLRGQALLMPDGTSPTFYNLALGQAGMSLSDVKTLRMSDADIVRSAEAGKAKFAAPEGAVAQAQLQQAGWEPIITVSQLIDAYPDKTLDLRAALSTYLTTTSYAESHYNTLLRFTSVIYRVIHQLETDPQGAATKFTDYVNSYTGSNLSVPLMAATFSNGLYSMRDFDHASDFLTDPKSPYYFPDTANAEIQTLKTNGVLQGNYDVDNVSIATQVYKDLVQYRDKAKGLLKEVPAGDLKTKAQQFFDDYDYLDAYRLAQAASKS